jgi:O-antigen ligase
MVNFLQTKRLLLFNKNHWHFLSVIFMGIYILSYLVFGQNLLLYLMILLLCSVCILMAPMAGIYTIMICTMWFERHFTLQELALGDMAYKIYPLDFIILFTLGSVIYRMVIRKEWIKWRKFDNYILLFGLLVTLAFVYSFVQDSDIVYAFSTYKNYFLYSVIYFLLLYLARTKADWQSLMKWFFVGGLGLFFFLAYGIISGVGLWSEYTPLSTEGVRLIAGTHIFFLTIFGFFLLSGVIWHHQIVKDKNRKYLLILLYGVVLALLVSLVRHLWLALLILAILWLVLFTGKNYKKLVIILKASVLFVLFGLALFIWGNSFYVGVVPDSLVKTSYILAARASIINVASMNDSSFRWRVNAWSAGANLWLTSPYIGVGLGRTLIGSDQATIYEVPIRELHNDYLGILIQLGLVGLVFVGVWFTYVLRQLKKLWDKLYNKPGFELSMLFTWGNTVLLFIIVFSVSVYWDLNLFIIWWWFALAVIRFLLYENSSSK